MIDVAAPTAAEAESVVERDGDDFVVDGERVTFPKTVEECAVYDGHCPWARCRYNLMVDVDEKTGSLGVNCGRVMTVAPRRYARAIRQRDHAMPVTSVDEVEGERRARAVVRTWIDGGERTCALWHANHRTRTLEEMGDMMNVTRERVRQIEMKAVRKVLEACVRDGVRITRLGEIGRQVTAGDVRRFLDKARQMLLLARQRVEGLEQALARFPGNVRFRELLAHESEILVAMQHNVRVLRKDLVAREHAAAEAGGELTEAAW